MPKILTEDTIVEVGKFYQVPCAIIVTNIQDNEFGFVPIIGEAHKDAQFGVTFKHYHIDGRFADVKNEDHCIDDQGLTNAILAAEKPSNWGRYVVRIEMKVLKCRRLTTGIKPPANAEKYNLWYDSMVGKSCQGKRCPHLGTLMHERDGILVCPLHNLKGCIKTEKILPR